MREARPKTRERLRRRRRSLRLQDLLCVNPGRSPHFELDVGFEKEGGVIN
jgi:hypothetical protein